MLLAEKADVIYLIPLATDGTTWEVEQIIAHKLLAKTVFIMPPEATIFRKSEIERLWEEAVTHYAAEHLTLPPYFGTGMVFRYNEQRRLASQVMLPLGLTPKNLAADLDKVRTKEIVFADPLAKTSRSCPNCGAKKTRRAVADKSQPSPDRICVKCGTRYRPPMSLLEGLGILLVGLVLGPGGAVLLIAGFVDGITIPLIVIGGILAFAGFAMFVGGIAVCWEAARDAFRKA
jgi:hypothetical protein